MLKPTGVDNLFATKSLYSEFFLRSLIISILIALIAGNFETLFASFASQNFMSFAIVEPITVNFRESLTYFIDRLTFFINQDSCSNCAIAQLILMLDKVIKTVGS